MQGSNLDRDGAFPGLDGKSGWKYYALCVGCADLLYVYWYHIGKADFLTPVAGEQALVIPTLNLRPADNKQFIKRLKDWVAGGETASRGGTKWLSANGNC